MQAVTEDVMSMVYIVYTVYPCLKTERKLLLRLHFAESIYKRFTATIS
jgi:hypothetical protein